MSEENESRRRAFACPPTISRYRGADLSLLDPADVDDRRSLIEVDHPELRRALERGQHEIRLEGHVMNPFLHIALHEVVANQIWDGEPVEVWATAERLTALGYKRHDVLHMLGSVVTAEIWEALARSQPYDHKRYVGALDALPESWEGKSSGAERTAPRIGRRQNRPRY